MFDHKKKDIICITNRTLCREDFLERIKKITDSDMDYLVLREKDLSKESYFELAEPVINICKDAGKTCILHSFFDVAMALNYKKIHLPLPVLQELDNETFSFFDFIGASAHSLSEAEIVLKKGCKFITLSHIFKTDCKAGLKEKGVELIRQVKENLDITVYGLGGINEENANEVIKNGADGICIMSGFMKCENPKNYVERIRRSM
ncbi:MAG: thiamine phosphate synthase [Lachnospiraceae bacterium]|nr:thiamine phosphate synthase [Lachnospiraceae bacterium]